MECVRFQPTGTKYCASAQCTSRASPEFRCCRCEFARYCSRAHQISDITRHKRECTNPAPTTRDIHPSQALNVELKTVKVFLFPMNGLPAQIISVECRVRASPIWHGLKEEWIDLRSVLNASSTLSAAISPYRQNRASGRGLYLVAASQTGPDTPTNGCIQRYARECGNVYSWKGNLVGVRCREPTTKYIQYLDVVDKDLDAFITYFQHFGTARAPLIPQVLIHRLD
ncbi:hypothetical protein C8Q77DRAFT_423722 [Trametes polyzona]|nr:hypothetical protein C8Q77DRAFT_423722 [Trametes polyzona]